MFKNSVQFIFLLAPLQSHHLQFLVSSSPPTPCSFSAALSSLLSLDTILVCLTYNLTSSYIPTSWPAFSPILCRKTILFFFLIHQQFFASLNLPLRKTGFFMLSFRHRSNVNFVLLLCCSCYSEPKMEDPSTTLKSYTNKQLKRWSWCMEKAVRYSGFARELAVLEESKWKSITPPYSQALSKAYLCHRA